MKPRPARPPAARQRAEAALPLKPEVFLFGEGKNTEEGWVQHLRRQFLLPNLRYEYKGVPISTVEAALSQRAVRPRRGAVAPEVWVILDRDEHDLTRALADARDGGVGIVFSNPCFELWAILHRQAHTRPIEHARLQSQAAALIPGYDHDRKATIPWYALAPQADVACRRALGLHPSIDPTVWTGTAAQPMRRPSGALRNPTTTAWLLHLRCQHAATLDSGAPLAADHPLVVALRDSGHPGELVACLPEPHRSRAQAALDTPMATR